MQPYSRPVPGTLYSTENSTSFPISFFLRNSLASHAKGCKVNQSDLISKNARISFSFFRLYVPKGGLNKKLQAKKQTKKIVYSNCKDLSFWFRYPYTVYLLNNMNISSSHSLLYSTSQSSPLSSSLIYSDMKRYWTSDLQKMDHYRNFRKIHSDSINLIQSPKSILMCKCPMKGACHQKK